MARPCPNTTSPTASLLPAMSNATTLCTIIAMKKATMEPSAPTNSTRKSRTASAAKVSFSQPSTRPPYPIASRYPRKQAERQLLEAKQRSEKASKLVTEKNSMLEALANQLSKYLSPQVYDSIFSGEQSVKIESKRKKLTVFFADIADFTGITESLGDVEGYSYV